jgi:hypothetical protein
MRNELSTATLEQCLSVFGRSHAGTLDYGSAKFAWRTIAVSIHVMKDQFRRNKQNAIAWNEDVVPASFVGFVKA